MAGFGLAASTITSGALTTSFVVPTTTDGGSRDQISVTDLALGTILVASDVTAADGDFIIYDDISGGVLGRTTMGGVVVAGLATANSAYRLGTTSGGGSTLASAPIAPSQITSDQNNYAPGVGRYYLLTSDATRTITGLSVSQVDGQEFEILNTGNFNIVFANESASSTAANRFTSDTGADITLLPLGNLRFRYDGASQRFRVFVTARLRFPSNSQGAGNDLPITAQSAGSGNTNGGTLRLIPGLKAGSGADGIVTVQQPGGTPGTSEIQLSHTGSVGTVTSANGELQLRSAVGSGNAISVYRSTTVATGFNVQASGQVQCPAISVNSIGGVLLDSAGVKLASSLAVAWYSANVTDSPVVGLSKAASKVLVVTDGSSGTGWIQNSAGTTRLSADVTNATATMTNLTALSQTVIAGRKYVGRMLVFGSDSTAVDGIQFDFNGGAATMTSFAAAIVGTPVGTTLGTTSSTALGTAITATTATTGVAAYEIAISFVVNAAGTFIPRMAQVSHSAGTATAALGSFLMLNDCPN